MNYADMKKKRDWHREEAEKLQERMKQAENDAFVVIKKSDIVKQENHAFGANTIITYKMLMILPEHPAHEKLQELYGVQ